MKLSKEQLKQIIKEELEAVLSEEGVIEEYDEAEYKKGLSSLKSFVELGSSESYKKALEPATGEQYEMISKAIAKAMQSIDIEAMDWDRFVKDLGAPEYLNPTDVVRGYIVHKINRHADGSDDAYQYSIEGILKDNFLTSFAETMEMIVNDGKRGFMQKAGSFLKGKGFKQ